MKKLFFAAIVAVAGWFTCQAQTPPAPERYNKLLEQAVQLDQTRAEFLMNATMETLAKDPKGYRQMMELAEKRFSDPADPIHNEGMYMVVLKHATENFVLSNAEKEKQRLLLEGAKKNMIGSVATDFDYVTAKDKTVHHLKELKADNILVYFNNPDCESCELVKERLSSNELINRLVNEKKLIVLGIYPYDDGKLWKKSQYPKMMINGWNQSRQIEYNELYDLPTLPCFYLLDKDFKVIMKNEGSLNKVEAKLKELSTAQTAGPAPAPAPQYKANPAPQNDPNIARCEQLFGYLINNQYNEAYGCLADELKAQSKAEDLNGAIAKTEGMFGKYQSREAWEIRKFQEYKTYTSILNFEKGKAGIAIVFDNNGKINGVSFVPETLIKEMPAYQE